MIVQNSPDVRITNSPRSVVIYSSKSEITDSPDSTVIRSHGYTLRGKPNSKIVDGIRHGWLFDRLRSFVDPLFDLVDSPQEEKTLHSKLNPFWKMFTGGQLRHWTDSP